MDSSTPQELINPSRIDMTHASTLSTRSSSQVPGKGR